MGKCMKVSASKSFGQRQPQNPPASDVYIEEASKAYISPAEILEIEEEQRRYRRVRVRLSGRFMRADQREYPCYTNDVSAGGLNLSAPVDCEIGEYIVAYIEEVGRVEGFVVRLFDDGFALALKASQYKREKIIATLTWLLNRHELSVKEARRFERLTPTNPTSILRLDSGVEIETRVLDLSLGGARIEANSDVRTGDAIRLGKTRGRVVRADESGIAIEFDREQSMRAVRQYFS